LNISLKTSQSPIDFTHESLRVTGNTFAQGKKQRNFFVGPDSQEGKIGSIIGALEAQGQVSI
jgi:hypothetical protein